MAKNPYITIGKTPDYIDHTVTIKGWVQTIRDMGKIAFMDIRDYSGLLQVVVDDPSSLPKLGNEYVVEIVGTIRKRGERFVNKNIATGEVELGAESVSVISVAAELPFEITKDTSAVNEETRLKYRYLDLRSERMAHNLRLRHRVIKYIRNYFDDREFTEVETPNLTKGTPEGAREYLVPARQHPGSFYVLPQSPQQFKQLLMVAGLGKYYQIARCFRDEDQRGDRQPEFTQLDVELSFPSQEDILNLTEELLIGLVKATAPEKHISQLPFPRMTYAEAMEQYGSDKPDIRKDKTDPNELAFLWVVDFPMFEKSDDGLGAVHHPFTSPKAEDIHLLESEPLKVRANAYDIVLNGYEIGGGSIRIHDPELQRQAFRLLGLSDEQIQARFGHMLEAFTYGVPPHGGIAWGLERLIMILAGEPNIREVMVFPKTGDARDPLTGAPTPLEAKRLKEVYIESVVPKKSSK